MAEVCILSSDDRVELIQGEIIEMSPIASKHAAIVNNISNQLMWLNDQNAIISVQNPMIINDLNAPEPDIPF